MSGVGFVGIFYLETTAAPVLSHSRHWLTVTQNVLHNTTGEPPHLESRGGHMEDV